VKEEALTQKGVQLLTERDIRLLRLICEQYLLSIPQIAYITGRSERTARWLRTRWERAGLVRGDQLVLGDATYLYTTRAGLSLCGYRFKPVQPRLWAVNALAAVELRLAAEEQRPGIGWRSRRVLAHEPHPGDHVPDGVLLTDGRGTAVHVEQRHWVDQEHLADWIGIVAHRYEHILLAVTPRLTKRTQAIVKTHGLDYRVSVIAYQRDPKTVRLPLLPPLASIHVPPPNLPGWQLDELRAKGMSNREIRDWAAAAPTPETGAADDPTPPPEPDRPAVRIRPRDPNAPALASKRRDGRKRTWR
jgi:hypothetical protein